MRRVIISHLGPAQETEIQFLLDLAAAFRDRGYQPILWSAIYDRRFAPYYLPLNWRLKELRNYFADLSPRELPGLDIQKWRERVNVLIKQDWSAESRDELLQHLLSMSAQVIALFEPDLVLAWNTLCPHTGVACDLNRLAGRQGWLIEKAVFPHTWFIERGGLVGHSILAGATLESLIPAAEMEKCVAAGKAFLGQSNFGAYNRYAQAETSAAFDRIREDVRRPRIAFFPPDDGTLGFVPADGPDRIATVPHYPNSFEAAKALSKAHGGVTVYKVHPSLASHPHDTTGFPDLHVVDYDFRKVIEWADIVATTGSGLEFIAMAMGKPVLLLGNDILAGKGIAYEGQEPADLSKAIAAAQARQDFDSRVARFHAFCGWLISEYLASPSDAPAPARPPKAIVDDILSGCPAQPGPPGQEVDFLALRATLLTPSWRAKLARDTEAVRMLGSRSTNLITEPDACLAAVKSSRDDLVLDFDHTLILQNSTERWLDALQPKPFAFLVCLCCDLFVGFAARRGWCKAERWRDQVRVIVTTMLFPWNYVWWRMSARQRMARYVNPALREAVASAPAKEIVILSFGFKHIIAPLLASLPFKATLLASHAFSTSKNLRKRGKVDTLLQYLGPERMRTALFVTDSKEDEPVIQHTGHAALLQWTPYPPPAFSRTYFPMRYAVQGKYSGRSYFKTQILQEDLAIWLLAYSWSLATLPSLVCLFLSMYCVYEMGYWRNDHVAAKNEAKPTLSKTVLKFARYPIDAGWAWAIVLGIIGLILSPWMRLAAESNSTLDLPYGPAAWPAALLLLYGAFEVFNRLPVYRRPYLFPALHFIKNFAPILVFPLNPLGWLLLSSQLLCQMMVYIAHRSGGSGAAFNRQAQRMVTFVTPFLAIYCCAPAALDTLPPGGLSNWGAQLKQDLWHAPVIAGSFWLQLTLILVWMAFRTMQRAYGKGIVAIMSTALRKLRGAGTR